MNLKWIKVKNFYLSKDTIKEAKRQRQAAKEKILAICISSKGFISRIYIKKFTNQ